MIDHYGSRRVPGKKFDVLEVRGPVFGPSYHSQLLPGAMRAICYTECHLNASTAPSVNWGEVIVGRTLDRRRSEIEKRLGETFLARVCGGFGHQNRGVRVGGRGSGNIYRTSMPSMLIEPGFISNPEFYKFAATGEGADAIGSALAFAIHEVFPAGGLVALRLGHAYRGPNGETLDSGAPAAESFDPAFDSEIEVAGLYMQAAIDALIDID